MMAVGWSRRLSSKQRLTAHPDRLAGPSVVGGLDDLRAVLDAVQVALEGAFEAGAVGEGGAGQPTVQVDQGEPFTCARRVSSQTPTFSARASDVLRRSDASAGLPSASRLTALPIKL